jgi:2-amino-4-hydroxy-6-hydroxymethyldihydropteridine diphosphokinase
MNKYYLSIGSNCNAIENINAALVMLAESFGHIIVSNVYKNSPIGNGLVDYHNLSAAFDAPSNHSDLVAELKIIENKLARDRSIGRNKGVTIDLDVILSVSINTREVCYYTKDIVNYSFILAPLAEIADGVCDPITNKSYQTLWQEFDKSAHPLQKININEQTA